MKSLQDKAMFIYVSGPYTATHGNGSLNKDQIKANVEKANDIGLQIASRGHIPFIPHTMMNEWEENGSIDRERALEICYRWLEKCDGLFFMAGSEGAESERLLAKKIGLPIYRSLDDIPDRSPESPRRLSPEAVQGHIIEYQQCAESYRHTYATIWQAGAIFAAVSAAIIAFSNSSNTSGLGLPWWIQLLAPMPVIFWWWGIYVPMNRYGELRSDRLKAIEEILNDGAASDLNLQHFRNFHRSRRLKFNEGMSVASRIIYYSKERILTLRCILQPRVVEIVTLFGFALSFLEIYLIRKNWAEIAKWLQLR